MPSIRTSAASPHISWHDSVPRIRQALHRLLLLFGSDKELLRVVVRSPGFTSFHCPHPKPSRPFPTQYSEVHGIGRLGVCRRSDLLPLQTLAVILCKEHQSRECRKPTLCLSAQLAERPDGHSESPPIPRIHRAERIGTHDARSSRAATAQRQSNTSAKRQKHPRQHAVPSAHAASAHRAELASHSKCAQSCDNNVGKQNRPVATDRGSIRNALIGSITQNGTVANNPTPAKTDPVLCSKSAR